MKRAHHDAVTLAYQRLIEVLLALKAEGITADQLADAIARAAYQAGIERIK